MKKLVSFLLVFVLAFSLSVSAFASDYNGYELPDFSSLSYIYENAFITKSNSGNNYYLYTFDNSYASFVRRENGNIFVSQVSNSSHYMITSSKPNTWQLGWKKENVVDNVAADTTTSSVIWSNVDIYNADGTIYFADVTNVVRECDGSACPANDLDFDNICDDCGKVLTMSLRSTLLDYAKNYAETNGVTSATHEYYAVVEVPGDPDKYVIYASEILMGSTDGETVTGGNMKRCFVVTMEDGSFGHQGWGAVDSWSGNVVYANHTIPFFFRAPLVMTVQGPTGETMEMGTLKLAEVFSTLTLCGVGLMALLVLCVLLSKKLRRFMA